MPSTLPGAQSLTPTLDLMDTAGPPCDQTRGGSSWPRLQALVAFPRAKTRTALKPCLAPKATIQSAPQKSAAAGLIAHFAHLWS